MKLIIASFFGFIVVRPANIETPISSGRTGRAMRSPANKYRR